MKTTRNHADQLELAGYLLAKKYRRWIKTESGQTAKREVTSRARKLKEAGVQRRGIDCIWTDMRNELAREHEHGDEDGFKLNNNWRRFLAHEIMDECEDLRGFFPTRRSGKQVPA